jgi:hypothetical protein
MAPGSLLARKMFSIATQRAQADWSSSPMARSRAHGEVEDGVVDGAEDPTLDAAVRLVPIRVGRIGGERAIDVQLEAKFAAQRLEVGRPLAVVGVLYLQRDGNMELDGDGGVGVDHNHRQLISEGLLLEDDIRQGGVSGSRRRTATRGRGGLRRLGGGEATAS